ncbi:phenylalanine--tRNA ligase subunit beta [Nocardioidaceae bacterium]|nr:phenylalanine--tRNA ligase subunit beta [Nocardioidaceae bacterium]
MRVPFSWLRELVELPEGTTPEQVAEVLTSLGLKLEVIHGSGVSGNLVVGRVLSAEPETHKNGKTVNWCRVDVGSHNDPADGDVPASRGIVCGAHNFGPGDLVVAALPGTTLPGDFHIAARKTYGHVSDGMICSTTELGLGGDGGGILVLTGELAEGAEPGDDALRLLGLDDVTIELEVATDRGYALSMRGVARDVAIGFDLAYEDPGAPSRVTGTSGDDYPVTVSDPDACPVFVTRTVTGFDASAPTPAWLARRVEAAGMRSISLAVDVTNYVMLELGQPIHGYDRAQLQGPIVVRRAEPGEKVTTLDSTVRELTGGELLITDDSGPIGLAGVMGGETTELSGSTTEVVIESACFDAATIGRTARAQRLPSEASKRFERGVDPRLAPVAADRVAQLLAEHGGGTIDEGRTVVGSAPEPSAIAMPVGLTNRISGLELDAARVVETLELNGCSVDDPAADPLQVTPPTWRPDLVGPYDLVEEVVRVVGYDRIDSVLPDAPAGRGLTAGQRLRRRVGTTLAGAGLVEVKSYPFVGTPVFDAMGVVPDDDRRRMVRLANPLSDAEPFLTTTLLPGLLTALRRNVGRGIDDVALFETAAVFLPGASPQGAPLLAPAQQPTEAEWQQLNGALPAQPLHAAGVLTGRRTGSGWWGTGESVTWADAVESVRRIADALGVVVEVSAGELAPWHPGRCAVVSIAGEAIGHAGELHPQACRALEVPPRTVAFEVDLSALLAAAPEGARGPRFSTFPVAKEDVALVVEEAVPASEVRDALVAGAGELCESVRLFDVYRGEQVGKGNKSLAFALRFRAPDKTLTDKETAAARDAAVASAVGAVGAEQR